MSIPTPIVAPSISGIPTSDLTAPITGSILTSGSSTIKIEPMMYPGLEWVQNLQPYEIDKLRRLVNDVATTGAYTSDTTYLIDFVRYLLDAIKRNTSDYSTSNYQLAENIAKLLSGKATTPTTNPDYSSRINVAEIDLIEIRAEIKALKESMSNLREEINHKDKVWGSF